ncbi:MAG: hypothetical protein ACI857_002802 [Arenicella sp.]|jgi:hypothetical protein
MTQDDLDSLINDLPQGGIHDYAPGSQEAIQLSESEDENVMPSELMKEDELLEQYPGLGIVEDWEEPFDSHPYILFATTFTLILFGTVIQKKIKNEWLTRNRYLFLYCGFILAYGTLSGFVHYSDSVRTDFGLVIITGLISFAGFAVAHAFAYEKIAKVSVGLGLLGFVLSFSLAFPLVLICQSFGIQQLFNTHDYWEWVYAAGVLGVSNIMMMFIFKYFQSKKQLRLDRINELTGRTKTEK